MVTTVIRGKRTASSEGGAWKNVTSDGVTVDDFLAENVGVGLVSIKRRAGVVRDLTISRGTIKNIGRLIAMPYGDAELDGFVVRDLVITEADTVCRFKKARNGLIENVVATGSKSPQESFPSGCYTDKDHAQDSITYRRCTMNGFRQTDEVVGDGYGNGDGFADEPKSTRMVYEDCTATDNRDAGADLKSKGVRVERLFVARNGRNLRLWGSGTVTGLRSEAPVKAHIWLGGGPRLGDYTITDPVFVDGSDLRPHLDIDPRDDYGSVTITVVNPRDGSGRALTGETLRVRGPQRQVRVVVKAGLDAPPVPGPSGGLTEERVRQIVREELGR